MYSACYGVMFVLSIALFGAMLRARRNHEGTYFVALSAMVVITCFGYLARSMATVLPEAYLATKILYVDGSFLPAFLLLGIMKLSGIRLTTPKVAAAYVYAIVNMALVFTLGYNDFYYTSFTMDITPDGTITHATYGPGHTIHDVLIALFALCLLATLIYAIRHRKTVSWRIILGISLIGFLAVFTYGLNTGLRLPVEIQPAAFLLEELILIMLYARANRYNVRVTGEIARRHQDQAGYVLFDTRRRYIGAHLIDGLTVPDLDKLFVDSAVPEDATYVREFFLSWIDGFEAGDVQPRYVEQGEYVYKFVLSRFCSQNGKRNLGYLFTIRDDTADQRRQQILEREVAAKTARIREMNDSFILGMATMVESRDSSTGGHIMRTSRLVHILTDAMAERHDLCPVNQLPSTQLVHRSDAYNKFLEDLVKAAPMHDLGKIAVDDAILRKPGRFTPEEFAAMKAHASEGGRIVAELLKDSDDRDFAKLAENVARYHHERFDGKGYPEGLVGHGIPIEARIMAVADVYDALVSKRCYKDAMPFDKAASIIHEGMGTQFDPALEALFDYCRPAFETYYQEVQD